MRRCRLTDSASDPGRSAFGCIHAPVRLRTTCTKQIKEFRMRARSIGAIALASVCLALTACGDDDDEAAATLPAETMQPSPTTMAPATLRQWR